MQITKTIKALAVHEYVYFGPQHKDSVTTICTRLSRSGAGTFSTKNDGDKITVTRLTEPSTTYISVKEDIQNFNRLATAKESLKWALDQHDSNTEPLNYKLTLTYPSGKQVFAVPVGASFPDLAKALSIYFDTRIKNIQK